MEYKKILIATPVYGNAVAPDYMISVRNMEMALHNRGIKTELCMLSGTIIHRLRNIMINIFLMKEDFSHILFIDSDMMFSPSAVEKLLDSGKPFCGCLYPAKRLDLNAFYLNSKKAENVSDALAMSQPFVSINYLHLKPDGESFQYAIADGFIRTLEIGCGVTLIHRLVIEEIRSRCTEMVMSARDPEYIKHLGDVDVVLAFEPMRGEDGRPLGEDLSFCYRWTKQCNGEIWALVDQEIGHIGSYMFRGVAQDFLAGNPPRPKT